MHTDTPKVKACGREARRNSLRFPMISGPDPEIERPCKITEVRYIHTYLEVPEKFEWSVQVGSTRMPDARQSMVAVQ
jgi:hypothetical protein